MNVLAFALRYVDRFGRGAIVALVLFRILERVALAMLAIAFTDLRLQALAFPAILLGGVALVRGGIRSALRARIAAAVHRGVGDALLSRNLMRAAALQDAETLNVSIEGGVQVARVGSEFLPDLVGEGLACALLLPVVFARVGVDVEVATLAALGVAAAIVVVSRRTAAGASARAWRAYAPVIDVLEELTLGRAEIVGNGARASFTERFDATLARYRREVVRADAVAGLAMRLPLAVGALVAGTWLVFRSAHAFPWGDMLVVIAASPACSGVIARSVDLRRAASHIGPLLPLFEGDPLPQGGSADAPTARVVHAAAVAYAYEPHRQALAPTSLSANVGQIVVVVGVNGSGKSTLLRLLAGLASPSQGRITVNEAPLASCDLETWRAQVAYLPQRAMLPDRATIEQAFRNLLGPIEDGEIERSLRLVGVWSVLSDRTPDPMRVTLGALSAGQKQRVAIARTLVRPKPVLLLDEPDASLDADGIALLASVLRERAAQSIIVVSAHARELIARLEGACVVHDMQGDANKGR